MARQEYASTAAFARLVGVSASTVRRRIEDDSLVVYQPGGRGTALRIDVAASLRKLSASAKPPDSASPSDAGTGDSPDPAPSLSGPKPRWMGNSFPTNRNPTKDAKTTNE